MEQELGFGLWRVKALCSSPQGPVKQINRSEQTTAKGKGDLTCPDTLSGCLGSYAKIPASSNQLELKWNMTEVAQGQSELRPARLDWSVPPRKRCSILGFDHASFHQLKPFKRTGPVN